MKLHVLTRKEELDDHRLPGKVVVVLDVLFHYVFALFKLAVIIQQIYRRYVDGHTTDPRFASLGQMVRVLGTQAARALDRGRIHDLG